MMTARPPEFRTVPNGSEPSLGTGRPPVMNDDELRHLADQLNSKHGRPPRAEELIAAAGGCQRKRALAAIKKLKLDLAQRAVRSRLVFHQDVEHALRAQMASWLDLASSHLAAQHLDESERTEAKLATQAALIEELQTKVRLLQEGIGDRERMVAEFRARAEAADASLARAQEAQVRAEVLAEERARILNQLRPAQDEAQKRSR